MHVIRLRAAWRHEAGGVAVRRFNKPTGLDRGDRVWLVWEGAVAHAELNGEPLDASVTRHDVTDRLRPANELRLTDAAPSTCAAVRLDIASHPLGEGH